MINEEIANEVKEVLMHFWLDNHDSKVSAMMAIAYFVKENTIARTMTPSKNTENPHFIIPIDEVQEKEPTEEELKIRYFVVCKD